MRRVRKIIKGGPGSGHFGHAGRPGKRGGSLPGGGTRDFLLGSGLLNDWGDWSREVVAQAYQSMGVLPGHFDKLKAVTLKTAPSVPWFDYDLPEEAGVYDGTTRMIHLNPLLVFGSVGPYVLGNVATHELGHHLIETRWPKLRVVSPQLFSEWPDVLFKEIERYGDESFAAKYGIPADTIRFSLSADEVLADAFLTRLKGTPDQWSNLHRAIAEYNLDIDELFGP